METIYNTQIFDKRDEEQVKQFYDFLKILMVDNSKHYNDLHIYQDDFYFIIEWVQNDWNTQYDTNNHWRLLEPEDTIYTEIYLPDHTYQWVQKGTEDEFMENWFKENPGWSKNEYGVWVNNEENDKMLKEIYKDLGERVGIK